MANRPLEDCEDVDLCQQQQQSRPAIAYEALQRNFCVLTDHVLIDPIWLAGHLFQNKIISAVLLKDTSESPSGRKAITSLISAVLEATAQNGTVYDKFIQILNQDASLDNIVCGIRKSYGK